MVLIFELTKDPAKLRSVFTEPDRGRSRNASRLFQGTLGESQRARTHALNTRQGSALDTLIQRVESDYSDTT